MNLDNLRAWKKAADDYNTKGAARMPQPKIPVHLDTYEYFRARAVLKREFPNSEDPEYSPHEVVVTITKMRRADQTWVPCEISTYTSPGLAVAVVVATLQEFLAEAANIAQSWDITPPDPYSIIPLLDTRRYEIIREEEDDD